MTNNEDFIYLFKKREGESMSQGKGRRRSRLLAEQGAWCGAQSRKPVFITWAESSHLTTEPPWRPSDDRFYISWTFMFAYTLGNSQIGINYKEIKGLIRDKSKVPFRVCGRKLCGNTCSIKYLLFYSFFFFFLWQPKHQLCPQMGWSCGWAITTHYD